MGVKAARQPILQPDLVNKRREIAVYAGGLQCHHGVLLITLNEHAANGLQAVLAPLRLQRHGAPTGQVGGPIRYKSAAERGGALPSALWGRLQPTA